MPVLVIDVGTTSVRVALVGEDGSLLELERAPFAPHRPMPGLVEFDAAELAALVEELALRVLAGAGPVAAVGIANQRASTVLWDSVTGSPLAPALGWQDLRTTGRCLALQAHGLHFAPNQTATKLLHLLEAHKGAAHAPCAGTLDSWLVWNLTRGETFVTDLSNAAVSGLVHADGSGWDGAVLEQLAIPETLLPEIVDSTGVIGTARALPGAPPIAALIGDQQASLVGQGCLRPGRAKATFGTGGMLDCVTGDKPPLLAGKGAAGTFPIVAWRAGGVATWGAEAILLSAGSCLEWLKSGLGLISSVEEADGLAATVRDSAGVAFVPALDGLGAPTWDLGARGTVLGLSSATTRAEFVYAVFEGVAQAGADLLEALERDTLTDIETIALDGGMSRSAGFVSLFASACGRTVQCSEVVDATVLGAAFLAGTAVGTWASLEEAAGTLRPRSVVHPARRLDRDRWLQARERALKTVPAMSAISF